MSSYRVIILFVLAFLIPPVTKSQKSLTYSFRHITQADGLLHNEVLSIAQDNKGFIWIATVNGLQRFDGSRFIYHPEMLSNPLGGRTSGATIYADKKNNLLWINNGANLEKMELGKNIFTIYTREKLEQDSSATLNPYTDATNKQWFLGPNVVYYYNRTTKTNAGYTFNILPPNAHQSSPLATDFTGNNTWVANLSHLLLFDKKNKKVFSQYFNPDHHPLLQPLFDGTPEKSPRFIMIDSRQNIWVTTWGDLLHKYDNKTKKVTLYSLSDVKKKQDGKLSGATPLINCMLEDDNHSIWVGTENAGLLRYNPENDNFDYCIAREKNSESIRYDYKIFSLFQDKEQNIWIATDKGISIFNPYRQYFKSIRHQENDPLSIGKSEILSFVQTANGDMYIGTWGGGITVYDNNFQFKKTILFDRITKKNFVWSLLQVDDKILWIGCQHGYLIKYNTLTETAQTLKPPEMDSSTIRCMEKDNEGNIWFGLHNGKIVEMQIGTG